MALYYVNKHGDHEVHVSTCDDLPKVENREYLGSFSSCEPAVKEAKKTYEKANGCFYCSRACHTG